MRKVLQSLAILLLLPLIEARIGSPRTKMTHDWDKVPPRRPRSLEVDEYPVPLEPFHLVYNHPQRIQTFEGMEEMTLLSTTRRYISTRLLTYRPQDFRRLALYLYVRADDENTTKVAYSGTAYFTEPTPPSEQRAVQDAAWIGFLESYESDYLLHLEMNEIFGIESVTLMNVGGDEIGVDKRNGDIIVIDPNSIRDGGMPDMSMSSDMSMTIYLCAIIIPVSVFLLVAIWWIARKLRFDVNWKPSRTGASPDDEVWRAPRGLVENKSMQSLEPNTTRSKSKKSEGKTCSIVPINTENKAGTDLVASMKKQSKPSSTRTAKKSKKHDMKDEAIKGKPMISSTSISNDKSALSPTTAEYKKEKSKRCLQVMDVPVTEKALRKERNKRYEVKESDAKTLKASKPQREQINLPQKRPDPPESIKKPVVALESNEFAQTESASVVVERKPASDICQKKERQKKKRSKRNDPAGGVSAKKTKAKSAKKKSPKEQERLTIQQSGEKPSRKGSISRRTPIDSA